MQSALYFPHTEVRNKNLLRTALMTWDNLEYICPKKDYQVEYSDDAMARAVKAIGRVRVPTEQEQFEVHTRLEELLDSGVPETFKYSPIQQPSAPKYQNRVYELWPEKLAQHTWSMLQRHKLTDERLDNGDYPTNEACGLTLMAILADVMAGQTRSRVTDRGLAYATIANIGNVVSNQPGAADRPPRMDAGDLERTVALTLKVPDLSQISIDRLIDFREREKKNARLTQLRQSYLGAIDDHVLKISQLNPDSSDRETADERFRTKMRADLEELKEELGFVRNAAWLSKDLLILVSVGVAAAVFGPAAVPAAFAGAATGVGSAVGLGGVLGAGNTFVKERRATLRRHPMAYVYELDRQF